VLTAIERTYARFLFRAPSPTESAGHIAHFESDIPTEVERQAAVRTGRVRRHLGIRPLKMETDVTNQCNLRCTFCHFSHQHISSRKRDDISIEDFTHLAEQVFPLSASVNLAYTAEPLLHRRFGELLTIAERYRVPSVGITSNALLLDEARIEQAIVGRLNHAVISIDGATKASYERLRRNGRFDRLVDNVRCVNEQKRRLNTRAPQLAFSFIMMRWHYVIVSRYGDVLPCGGWWEEPYGNVFRESFEDIWNNEPYKALRVEHMSGMLGNTCRSCPATMMGNVNSEGAFSVRTVSSHTQEMS
jgi:radical SAM protein with 4Fe4S-binding SPASM domain